MKRLIFAYFREYSNISLTIWLVMIAVFINAAGSSTNLFLSLYLATHLHINITTVGMILTSLGMGAVLGSYVSGKLSDTVSPHKMSVITLLGNALLLFCLPLVTGLWLLGILAFLLGVFNSAFIPANRMALMSLCTPDNRVRINGLRYTMLNLGVGVSVLIGGLLSTRDFKLIFVFNGLALLLATAVLLLFCWNVTQSPTEPKPKDIASIDKMSFLKNRVFILLGITAFIAFTFCNQLSTTYPIYLYHHYHINAQWFSYLFVLNTVLIVLLQMPVLGGLKNINQNLVAGSGIFLMGFGLFILPFGTSYSIAVISCVLWTLGEILAFAIVQTLFYEHAPEGYKGKAMGIFQLLLAFANMLGPVVGTWLYQFDGGNLLWYLCGLFGLLSLLTYVKLYFSTDYKLPNYKDNPAISN